MCEYCKLLIGNDYTAVGVIPCYYCATPQDTTGEKMKYVDYDGDNHIFRIHHSRRCHGCGTRLVYVRNPCGHSEIERELSALFGIKENIAVS